MSVERVVKDILEMQAHDTRNKTCSILDQVTHPRSQHYQIRKGASEKCYEELSIRQEECSVTRRRRSPSFRKWSNGSYH